MMEAIGGLLGVSQDPQTLALRPKVGWVVREAEKLDVLLARLTAHHKTFPGAELKRICLPTWPSSSTTQTEQKYPHKEVLSAANNTSGFSATCH